MQRRKWQPTPVLLPRESCGQRSLVGLVSMGSHRVGHNWSDLACMHALEKEMATHSSILAWKIPGTEEPGGLPSLGSHRDRHNWSDLVVAAVAVPCWLVEHIHILNDYFTDNRFKARLPPLPISSTGRGSIFVLFIIIAQAFSIGPGI